MKRVTIHTRDESGALHELVRADFKDEEFAKLERDYQSFLAIQSPLSGAYDCLEARGLSKDRGLAKRIVVNFGEIVGLY